MKAYRSAVLFFVDDPDLSNDRAYQYFDDALVLVDNGCIVQVADAKTLLSQLPPGTALTHYENCLIMPGFIDTHIHYAQTDIIASHGKQLLDWLNDYTFPAEARFADPLFAQDSAEFFLDQMLRNGTTTAMVFCTVHKTSAEALFKAAAARHLRLIAGKVMMDRNAPPYLLDTAQTSYQDSCELIEHWHGTDRLLYAVTPRFAPTSSTAQLAAAGRLLQQYSGLYLQTHLAENQAEIAWVQRLFPQAKHYLDVYDQHGLLGSRSVFAHAIHLNEDEYQRLADSASVIAFCPTSNLFIGSGLFDQHTAEQHGIAVTLATDIGGGTSFSLLQTLNEAYKIAQLRSHTLDPFKMFYMITLGAAKALQLDQHIGSLQSGREADFVVLDLAATPLLTRRIERTRTLSEKLFALAMLADDRAVKAVYSNGQIAFSQSLKECK